ncbi:ATP-binding protein [Glaciihabitans arcticus]|uniref:ATP-binding protein n=1 Tax=Glaciihabitans arcticus TaxID=2668039 RepID=A0A4Q9GM38_9MICO|nr:ATP-binding protein [Glaciihabitans arcticus]TBN55423.1 ATP-binding protein [Glaciihabitans arcticus]
MSLGFPIHLASHGVSWAYARACHVTAAVCLLLTIASTLLLQTAYPERLLWPTTLALLPMLAMLWLLAWRPSLAATVGYLLIGSASIFWFVLASSQLYPTATTTDTFIFTLPKVALILIGGVGSGVLPAAGWMFAAFVFGGFATVLGAMPSGMPARLDGTTIIVVALLGIVLALIAAGRTRVLAAGPGLYRAARDEHLSTVRQSLEIRAAAMLHDTVLGNLAAIAEAGDEQLPRKLREQIERDLSALVGEEWLLGHGESAAETSTVWTTSRLAKVIDEIGARGLTIDVSGDLSALSRLAVDGATAVALAVRQCLVNVVDHAGTDRAEVVLYGSESDVSVMVVDAGVGFVIGETGSDRLGLRHSVRSRIEGVGGSVQLWSTPGRGTSVLIRVPASTDTEPGGSRASAAVRR